MRTKWFGKALVLLALAALTGCSQPVRSTTPDASAPAADASESMLDTAGFIPDASMARPDASISTPDASTPEPDASMPEPDASTPEPDASTAEPDASTAELDASMPEPDAGPAVSVPGAPSGVTASAGNASATVTWTAPESTGGSPITQYTVTAAPGGTLVATSETTATLTGLTNGTSYTFTVHATNAIGDGPESEPSNAVIPVTVPGIPLNVTAMAGNAQATIAWMAPTDTGGSPITSYTVFGNPGGSVTVTDTVATVTGLTNGTTYSFSVVATNEAGSSTNSAPSNTVTPATSPEAPTNVTATAGNAQVTVSWAAPTDNGGSVITGYTITGTPGGSATTTDTSATITGLTNGVSYTFIVQAINAVGSGVASAPSNAVTPMPPPGTVGTTQALGAASGVVVDLSTGAIVSGAVVTLSSTTGSGTGSPASVTTGTNGTFALTAPTGNAILQVTRTGYLTWQRSVTLFGTPETVRAGLKPAASAQTVGSSGGTVAAGPVSIAIPAGAYSTSATISATWLARTEVSAFPGPVRWLDASSAYHRGHGVLHVQVSQEPALAASVTVPIPNDAVAANVVLRPLNADGTWGDAILPTQMSGGSATFSVSHFSDYLEDENTGTNGAPVIVGWSQPGATETSGALIAASQSGQPSQIFQNGDLLPTDTVFAVPWGQSVELMKGDGVRVRYDEGSTFSCAGQVTSQDTWGTLNRGEFRTWLHGAPSEERALQTPDAIVRARGIGCHVRVESCDGSETFSSGHFVERFEVTEGSIEVDLTDGSGATYQVSAGQTLRLHGEQCPLYFSTPPMYDPNSLQSEVQPGTIQRLGGIVAIYDSNNPSGLAFDPSGNLLFGVISYNPMRYYLRKLGTDGSLIDLGLVFDSSAGYVSTTDTISIAVSQAGDVYFATPPVFDQSQQILSTGKILKLGGGVVVDGLGTPSGLAFDLSGDLYFGEIAYNPMRFRLKMLAPDGVITDFGVVFDSSSGEVMASSSLSVAISPLGVVYFTSPPIYDSSHQVVTAGSIQQLGGGAVASGLNTPFGLACDASGNLYFSDVTFNPLAARMKRLAPGGAVADLCSIYDSTGFSINVYSSHFNVAVSP